MAGQNWFLIIVAAVVVVLSLVASLYILVNYMHPDDRNQAWFPKVIVVLSISLCMITVLAFPLDIGNTRACSTEANVLSACNFTLPMTIIWFIIFIVNCIFVFVLIPFTLFYYEQDEGTTVDKRIAAGFIWALGFVVMFGCVVAIIWGLAGKVEFDTRELTSGIQEAGGLKAYKSLDEYFGTLHSCLPQNYYPGQPTPSSSKPLCDATKSAAPKQTLEMRTSFPVYIIATASIIGWVTFIVFAPFGLIALPLDLIRDFFGRPKQTITKSEYIKRARRLGENAYKVREIAQELKAQERAVGRSRKWRGQVKELTAQMLLLEEEERGLAQVFPQGEDRDVKWGALMISFYLKLLVGVLFLIVAVAWLVHVVVYMLWFPPLTPFLNDLFTALDDVFPLFGVIAFAVFCGYLVLATIKGHIKLGVTPVTFFNAYPMRLGATLMSAFLVNSALMLLSSMAVVQFCTQAFAGYAQNTAVGDIFGQQIMSLKGVKFLFTWKIFIICFLVFALLGTIYYVVSRAKKWERKSKYAAYEM